MKYTRTLAILPGSTCFARHSFGYFLQYCNPSPLSLSRVRVVTQPSSRCCSAFLTSSNKERVELYSSKVMDFPIKVPSGGDFIGLSATFDTAGNLIPVPEYLIPESLVEWGQAPTCLEVITSETSGPDEESYWNRQVLTIYPETGCAIDNLEVKKTQEQVEDCRIWKNAEETVRVLSVALPNHRQRIEVSFGATVDEAKDHRVRVGINLQHVSDAKLVSDRDAPLPTSRSSWLVVAPIQIIRERQLDKSSSEGTRADGGGLDGRSVSTWLGDNLKHSYKFAEQIVETPWKPLTVNVETAEDEQFSELLLPTNITISYTSTVSNEDGLILRIGHVFEETRRHVVKVAVEADGIAISKTWVEEGSYEKGKTR